MTKQTLGKITNILAILLGLGLFIFTAGVAAGELPWPGATHPIPLAQRNDLRKRSAIAVAPGLDGNVSVAWASEDGGITLTQQIGGSWTQSQTVALSVTGKAGWHPNIVYSGTDVLATWVQGEAPFLGTSPSAIRQQTLDQDLNSVNIQTIITPVYGFVSPDVTIASTGIHLVFSASRDNDPNEISKWNLYYMHRPLTTSTWSTPTAVITSSKVLTPGMSGQVWYPRLAIGQDGTDLHIVWQQEAGSRNRKVWYIHGTWAATGITWDAPQRVSPIEQDAILPNIAVDQENQVHISWSEFIGAYTDAEAQYITYQRGTPDQGQSSYRLHSQILQVNNNFPTNTETSISTQGKRVCIAWYGWYGEEQIQGKEEIWMRCSLDRGLSWQREINIAQSPNFLSAYSQLHIDSQGQAHLIWEEFFLEEDQVKPQGLYYRTGSAYLAHVFLPLTLREQ